MEFRLANMQDLPQIKQMYFTLIEQMEQNQLTIWDDVYPCDFLKADIEAAQLYISLDGSILVSAFALTTNHSGASNIKWKNQQAKACYLERLGVHPAYWHQGIGGQMLSYAKQLAKQKGAETLRLFVADVNQPAMRLYEKGGFTRVEGIYIQEVDLQFTLREYGYEAYL